jgi:tRNA dimethylallyltransferase
MYSTDTGPFTGNPAGKPPLVVIVGPTAVGKTELSLRLAERCNGEIISADSRLFYRGMDIGTAKPTLSERARVPHHLIDIADPDEEWSLAVFQRAVDKLIKAISSRGKLPFLVGGTGQYVRAVYEGWKIPRQRPDRQLREVLETWGKQIGASELHKRLGVIDREAARKIEPQNLRRTVRALEVIFLTGEKFSEQRRRAAEPPYHVLILGLARPRQELYARIDARIEAMLQAGWLAEVGALLEAGYSPDLPGMSAIGYRQLAEVLQEERTLESAVMEIKRSSRQFVRRQANWFKPDDPAITWIAAGPGALEAAESRIRVTFGRDSTNL